MEARYYLGMALVMNGQKTEGLAQWRLALRRDPDNVPVLNETAWVLSTSTDAALRNGSEAVPLAEHAVELTSAHEPAILGTLAAAYAETRRFDKAVEVEKRAADLATAQSNAPLAATLAMVFSMDLRVMICEGRRLARTASISMRPASRVAACLSALVAGTPESWMGEMPRISPLMAMVLAVN